MEIGADSAKLDPQRTERTLTYSDPKTGLALRCVGIEYHDFPTVEWTLYFAEYRRQGNADPSRHPGVGHLGRAAAGPSSARTEFRLHHAVGSPCQPTDYRPLETLLAPAMTKRIAAAGGRPTNSDLSYFNVQTAADAGLIVVVGWPGQWAAQFTRDKENQLRICTGQELTHLQAPAGRGGPLPPMVAPILGREMSASRQNIWRRWMMATSCPGPAANCPRPSSSPASSPANPSEMIKRQRTNQIICSSTATCKKASKLDYWWMDAGWYCHHGRLAPRRHLGEWIPTVSRTACGRSPITLMQRLRILVWFEPEHA